jgi:hypothetical protein
MDADHDAIPGEPMACQPDQRISIDQLVRCLLNGVDNPWVRRRPRWSDGLKAVA